MESNESKHELYRLPVQQVLGGKKGWGVSLASKRDISYKVRNDLEYFNSEIESLLIEIDQSSFSATNDIGVIYRMPDFSAKVFNGRINIIMNTIQREIDSLPS